MLTPVNEVLIRKLELVQKIVTFDTAFPVANYSFSELHSGIHFIMPRKYYYDFLDITTDGDGLTLRFSRDARGETGTAGSITRALVIIPIDTSETVMVKDTKDYLLNLLVEVKTGITHELVDMRVDSDDIINVQHILDTMFMRYAVGFDIHSVNVSLVERNTNMLKHLFVVERYSYSDILSMLATSNGFYFNGFTFEKSTKSYRIDNSNLQIMFIPTTLYGDEKIKYTTRLFNNEGTDVICKFTHDSKPTTQTFSIVDVKGMLMSIMLQIELQLRIYLRESYVNEIISLVRKIKDMSVKHYVDKSPKGIDYMIKGETP